MKQKHEVITQNKIILLFPKADKNGGRDGITGKKEDDSYIF